MAENPHEAGARLKAAADAARSGASSRIGDIAGSLLVKAVLVGIIGILALFWPTASFRLLVLAVGVLLVIDGVAGIVGMVRANERGAFLGQSVFGLLVGGALLLWPDASARTLMLLLGAWALLHGAMLMWGLRQIPPDAPYRTTQRTVAIIMAILGLVLLLWPNIGVVTLSWVIGLAALALAGVLFWLSRRMKGLQLRIGGGT
jgi:uncharacterized membrane protein HdeD (DUF308 family)